MSALLPREVREGDYLPLDDGTRARVIGSHEFDKTLWEFDLQPVDNHYKDTAGPFTLRTEKDNPVRVERTQ